MSEDSPAPVTDAPPRPGTRHPDFRRAPSGSETRELSFGSFLRRVHWSGPSRERVPSRLAGPRESAPDHGKLVRGREVPSPDGGGENPGPDPRKGVCVGPLKTRGPRLGDDARRPTRVRAKELQSLGDGGRFRCKVRGPRNSLCWGSVPSTEPARAGPLIIQPELHSLLR